MIKLYGLWILAALSILMWFPGWRYRVDAMRKSWYWGEWLFVFRCRSYGCFNACAQELRLVNGKNLLEAVIVSVGPGWPQDLEHESLNVVSIRLVVAVNWLVNNALLLFSFVVLSFVLDLLWSAWFDCVCWWLSLWSQHCFYGWVYAQPLVRDVIFCVSPLWLPSLGCSDQTV